MYRYSNITKEEKEILKEYLTDGLDSYNYLVLVVVEEMHSNIIHS